MCFSMPKLTRQVEFACTVGDLAPGRVYRDPEGRTYMVTDAGSVVRLDDGTLQAIDEALRLGYDREGRLYASRRLNAKPPAMTFQRGTDGILRFSMEPGAPDGFGWFPCTAAELVEANRQGIALTDNELGVIG